MEDLIKKLQAAKLRVTIPRITVLKILYESGKPMTAYDIEKAVSAQDSSLFLTGIYGILRSFEQAKLVQRYKLADQQQALFSIKTQIGIIHCKCTKCGKKILISEQQTEELTQYLQQHFGTESYQLTLQNECDECQPNT